ncbi:MAG TPA: hypothetical protein VID24_02215 [Candidatus Eremiobacteraceae bacterium]|jgi:uncharacterized membrane protein
MKSLYLFSVLFGFVAFLSAGSAPADAHTSSSPTFKFVTFAVDGALQTDLTGVNDSGVIVGWYIDRQLNIHGFSLTNGTMTPINDPRGTNTQLFGINASGAIVGSYTTICQEELCSEGFLYQAGRFTDLGPPIFLHEDDPEDAPDSIAYGINDYGGIVGFGGDGFGTGLGFFRRGGNYNIIQITGGNDAIAVGVNKHGLVAVNWATDTTFNASLYDGTTFTTIDVPRASESFAGGVNNLGDVVLSWGSVEGGFLNGALLHRGKYYRFFDPNGKRDTIPLGINDRNVIVGAYSPHGTHDIHVYGFIATY